MLIDQGAELPPLEHTANSSTTPALEGPMHSFQLMTLYGQPVGYIATFIHLYNGQLFYGRRTFTNDGKLESFDYFLEQIVCRLLTRFLAISESTPCLL